MSNSLFFETRGQGPNLVLLHGWGLNSGVWEPISHILEQYFRITLLDLPGFGRNADVLPAQYDLDSVCSMVADCIPDKSSFIGWSLGGLVAQQLAISRPEQCENLVLVASSPKFSEAQGWPGIKANVLQAFTRQLEQDFSKTLDRFMAIQAMGSESAKQDIKLIKSHIQQYPIPDDIALRAGLSILANTDLRAQVGGIKCPTFRLYGRLDSLVPAKAIPLIENSQLSDFTHVFPHASHAPFISHPDEFIAILFKCLNITS
ncbi:MULTISPECIES: pimeloyl-ACP methyl ester esterase BioH [Aliiglaciecola]|uniref:pimeloyl-ACP methyl ester esterase BioH n=1 Tax=Aliiglaciecola TaxID=1406885 RepID=UPI001C0A29B5|nr:MULTISPECIES: pimeloyl-ACP methyl ester esterase BioH [Aliiglaciecola]MBU2877505.1 pimeloyl-ACP methyl ester esterase BioH [Aliiglaciecola lipolytica]MDO6711085.1 pimeloyl-ACP methyl ester esterase BioH [Aliiglaciecola sp. 2_MG-2023]MDO6751999.1 pimeloyl-ACP methyl ester esterase BioH [Aliiglaciecola sp. 1_MG-2023]